MDKGNAGGRFVGRAEELRLLYAELKQVRAGSPRVVLVEGQPGIGKTSLLRQFLVHDDHLRVLSASGDEAETRLPYGVLGQLVQAAQRTSGAEGLPMTGPAPDEDPLVAGAQLLHLLGELGVIGPLAVVVDDSHWSDKHSLQALSFALRRLHVDPVLTMLVTRENASTIPDGVRRLTATRGLHLHLDGLSVEELAPLASRIAGRALPRRLLDRLHEHTGGNPLHVETLLHELDLVALAASDSPLPAPRSFAMVTVSRLASCSPEARALVQAASVLGPPCSVVAACGVAAVEHLELALDEARDAGILKLQDAPTGPAIAFAHPLLRAAVYHDLGPGRRSELHARAARVTDGVASLDHRIAATLAEDPDLATAVASHARHEAGRGAVASAAGYLVAAARLSGARSDRERFLLDAVEQLLLGGEVAEASRLVHDVKALPESVRRDYLLGQLAFLSGNRREAEELLLSAWERCQERGDEELGPLVSLVLAQLCSTELRVDEAVAWSQRVTAGTAEHLMAPALGVLVPCLGAAGRADESLALAGSLPEGDHPLAIHDIEGVLGRGLVRMWVDDLRGACADLSAVVSATRSRPACVSGLIALCFLAEAEYRLGAWDDSLVHGDLAISLTEDSDQMWLAAFVYAGATWVRAARGDWAAAAAQVKAAQAVASQLGDPSSITCTAMAGVHLAFTRADHAALLQAVQPLLHFDERTPLCEPSVHPWRELYAEALVSLGRLGEAEEVVAKLDTVARALQRRSSLARAARVRGAFEAARQDPDAARESFEAALAHCDGLPAPFDRALVELAYGRFLRRAGERRAAGGHLGEAHSTFCRLGAEPFAQRCGDELAACGLAPRRWSSNAARFKLSPQELAVAKLVMSGATNREVATQLVVSVKTVEYHLGNLFAKLGIRSRRQLGARLAEVDIGDG